MHPINTLYLLFILDDEPKRRFLPSKWEMMRVTRIVQAMKEGKYKTLQERIDEKKEDRSRGPFLVTTPYTLSYSLSLSLSRQSLNTYYIDMERC